MGVEKKFVDLVSAIGSFVEPSRIFIAESSDITDIKHSVVRHDKFGCQMAIKLFLFNDCLIYGYYEDNKKGKLRFGSILVFDELFNIEDVPFDEQYNYQKISCLKLRARHHSMWISFRSYDEKLKWFEMISSQNNKLLEQNLNARRRSATNKSPQSPISPKEREENDLYLPIPVFVPDDYSDFCMECKSKFSLVTRRHHCYFCGNLCCSKCTTKREVDIWKLFFERKREYVRVCNLCKIEREEYLKEKQNEFMSYSNGTMVFKGTEEEKMKMDMEMNDDDDDEKSGDNLTVGSYPKLLGQSTFDITKTHQMASSRMSKRRVKMSLHHKQKSRG